MIAWHYTVGLHSVDILRGGFIKTATFRMPEGEKPIVWFSTRQNWEPTATKAWKRDGNLMTVPQMIERANGVWRFGLSAAELLPWKSLQGAACMELDVAHALTRAARKIGADPFFWYGSLEPVAVDRCVIQCRMAEADDWGPAK